MSNIVFVAESMCVSGKEQVTYVPLRIAVSSPLKSPLVSGASLRRHAPSKLAACSGHEIICVSKSFAKTAQNSKNATVACTNEANTFMRHSNHTQPAPIWSTKEAGRENRIHRPYDTSCDIPESPRREERQN